MKIYNSTESIDDFGDENWHEQSCDEELCEEHGPSKPNGRVRAKNKISELEDSGDIELWTKVGTNLYTTAGRTIKKINAGVFRVFISNGRLYFERISFDTDELIDFPNTVFSNMTNEIKEFWTKKDIYKKYGFLHRRGYLIYGIPGSGKSCLIKQIVRDVITERDGIVIYVDCSPSTVDVALRAIKYIEPKRKIFCIYEDLDAIVHTYGEKEILAILDGENQVDGVLNIATTNYPKKLDKRIINRPRRFDRLIKIETPDIETRKVYLKKKLNISGDELKEWAEKTHRFTFAALADLVISVKCFGYNLDNSVEAILKLLYGDIKDPEMGKEIITGFDADIKGEKE